MMSTGWPSGIAATSPHAGADALLDIAEPHRGERGHHEFAIAGVHGGSREMKGMPIALARAGQPDLVLVEYPVPAPFVRRGEQRRVARHRDDIGMPRHRPGSPGRRFPIPVHRISRAEFGERGACGTAS